MKYGRQTIGIIGIEGSVGGWLEKFFRLHGYVVLGSDTNTATDNIDVVEKSDVVMFAVPLQKMVPIIRDLVPFSRNNQLWMDVGSRKKGIIDTMLTSRAEVVGLHPLCAPPRELTLAGETLAFFPARLKGWSEWVERFLSQLKARIVTSKPSHHDTAMMFTQNVPQAATLAQAMTLADSGQTPDDLLKFSTTASRRTLAQIASMLANTPQVYADIQIGNPEGIDALDKLIRSLVRIRRLASQRKAHEIVAILEKLRIFYGEDFVAEGKKGFPR